MKALEIYYLATCDTYAALKIHHMFHSLIFHIFGVSVKHKFLYKLVAMPLGTIEVCVEGGGW